MMAPGPRSSVAVVLVLAGAVAGCLQSQSTPASYLVGVTTYYAGDDAEREGRTAVNGTLDIAVINKTAWNEGYPGANGSSTRAENSSGGYAVAARSQPKLLTPPDPEESSAGKSYLLGLGPDGEKRFRVPSDPPIMLKLWVRGPAPSGDGCENRRYSRVDSGNVKVNVTRDTAVEVPFDYSCRDRVG